MGSKQWTFGGWRFNSTPLQGFGARVCAMSDADLYGGLASTAQIVITGIRQCKSETQVVLSTSLSAPHRLGPATAGKSIRIRSLMIAAAGDNGPYLA